MIVYCDTCIYLDIFEGRKDKYRDLAEFALQVFRRVGEGEFTLVISDWLLEELGRHAEQSTISDFIEPFFKDDQVILINSTDEDYKLARSISEKNADDALHAVLAFRAGAKYLLTRNLRHYAGCELLLEIKLPENI